MVFYFKILDKFANKSNKAAICRACYEALGDEAKKLTNKANLCYNHLKSCPHCALKHTKEELEEILQLDKEVMQESDHESNEEENSSNKTEHTTSQNLINPFKRKKQTSVSQYLHHSLSEKIQQQFERHLIRSTVMNGMSFRWIEDEDIVAAFKLANPAIQLPLRRKLSGSILKKEVNITKEQFEITAKDGPIGVTLAFDGWKNVNAEDISSERSCAININMFTKKYIEDLATKEINVIRQLRNQQMNLYNGKAFALTSPCDTRWNSFYNSFNSILKSKDALTILVTSLENSNNTDNKKVPSDIAEIIEDSMFWNNLKELNKILLPFCATLNKLQCDSARLYDIMHAYAWIVSTIQRKPDSPFRSHMLSRLEKWWDQWEQPLLILSWLLHPTYSLKKLNLRLNSLSVPILGKWVVYYYKNWFDNRPEDILSKLEDFWQIIHPLTQYHLINLR
ncbi:18320_t:CDS:2, partial [Racocetra persica]